MLGISVSEFYSMTPKELYHALKTKREILEQDAQYTMRLEYVVARYQAALLLTPHLKNPITDVRELGAFSWEKKPVQSVDQMKHLLHSMARSANKKYKKDARNTK